MRRNAEGGLKQPARGKKRLGEFREDNGCTLPKRSRLLVRSWLYQMSEQEIADMELFSQLPKHSRKNAVN